MAQIIREITVDVVQTNNLRAIKAKQNDLNSRFLKINITNDGDPLKVEPNTEVIMNVKRRDDTSRMFYGSINDDGSITVPLTSWMLELEGSITCDVSIVSTEDLQRLTTMQFSIYVEPAVLPQSDLEENENYDVLTELLRAAEHAEDCAEATVAANAAAELATDAASGVRIVEHNFNNPLAFWVGTQAEYDAISEKDPDCFYIITDDPTQQIFYDKMAEVINAMQIYHTPVDISAAFTPEKFGVFTLYKCGKTLSIHLKFIHNSDATQQNWPSDTLLGTIEGYAPIHPYDIPFYLPGAYHDYRTTSYIRVEPDESGTNTLVKVGPGGMRTDGLKMDMELFSVMGTFICK